MTEPLKYQVFAFGMSASSLSDKPLSAPSQNYARKGQAPVLPAILSVCVF
jgi:hypothetical protein